MLKFFRRIRQQLLNEGNLKRYLIYAIGEILLVVLGILIALRINTWNENNKNNKAEFRALIELKSEFIKNSETLKSHLEHKRIVENEWDHLIKVTSGLIKAEEGELIFRKRTGTQTYIPTKNILNKLTFTGGIDKIKSDTLRKLLNTWEYEFDEFLEEEEFHNNFFRQHVVPYEMSITPTTYFTIKDNKTSRNPSPYHTSEELIELRKLAHKDFTYQNYILRNHYYIVNAINSGDELKRKLELTITMIDKEINTTKDK